MRAGRLSESPGRAARRSVRVRGETGGVDGAEGASGTATPCTTMTTGPSAPADPGVLGAGNDAGHDGDGAPLRIRGSSWREGLILSRKSDPV